ncbi:uncharacterized protein FA14DRAFT_159903 [Meira miltonrushii]|uniref:Yeast cell wall synthesis Kre9/Knh1-like N-terminal domain-containing protein n=1 Tax=Meira miltonrushii TaxID=1280837 RepID=A0A316VQ20_9BASI|nr:uncharacterized protein FA14DRAFT_159903 [Meira miltonrushii]PWN38251.1 hypothetical protein FA14DRAFT_159903 [Meira miltonrushii]
MFKFTSFLTIVLFLAVSLQLASASPAFTSPVASTSAEGGGKLQIKWMDDGKSPKYDAQNWGNSTLYLAAGSQNVQYKLQKLVSNLSSNRHGGSWTVDKTIGPSGKYYFIRMEGSKTDSSGNPVMAFSARFELKGMSGQFNSTVMAAATGAEGPAASGSNSSSSASSSSAPTTGQTGMNQATLTTSNPSSNPTPNNASTSKNTTSSAGRLSSLNVVSLVGSFAVAAVGVAAMA